MGAGRKTKTVRLQEKMESKRTVNGSVSARNLRRDDLGAVIFGCKNFTYRECIINQLFGLPASHFSYVKNVSIGLPLFLFNYSDRKLHGIFEAASHGKLNIDPNGWTEDVTESTLYEAQVRVRVQKLYYPLTEDQFAPIICDNYYLPKLFWFELDHTQTKRLVDLFSSMPAIDVATCLQHPSIWNNVFRSLPTAGPTDDSTSANTDITKEKPCFFLTGSTSASLSVVEPNSKKLWSSFFKSPASDTDKTDPILRSSSIPSSLFSDKSKMDREVCMTSSVDKDGHIDEWGSGEHEEHVESKLIHSSFLNESISPSLERQYTKHQSEHSEITASELNLKQLNELKIGLETSRGGDEQVDFLIDNDNMQVLNDGSTSVTNVEEEDQTVISQPFFSVNFGSEDGKSEVLETPKEVNPSNLSAIVSKLMGVVEELKRSKLEQDLKIMSLEQDLVQVHSKLELQQSKDMHNKLEPGLQHSSKKFEEVQSIPQRQIPPEIEESVVIVGGFDGSSWLSSLDSYFPFHDRVETLSSISFTRSHASAVKLSGELFLLGGRHGNVWFDTVESYNPRTSQWMQQPSMNERKGSLAGACLNDKIFAIGGGNGVQCFPVVETLDFNIGKWISAPSMMQKRFDPAAAVINGAIYVGGGYDGKNYLKSIERFDPRENTWNTVASMKTRRGCHSLVAYNEKLYAVGGYDGGNMVSSVEVLDPRFGSWVMGESMNSPRGCSAAVVIGGNLCVIGGVNDCQEVLDTIEWYGEGCGWQENKSATLGKRCSFSASVLQI